MLLLSCLILCFDHDLTKYFPVATAPDLGLYFTLNGTVYLSGDSVLITDIGEITLRTDPAGTTLVCETVNVNTHCCSSIDGPNGRDGGVGDWYFPNGTVVPRNSDAQMANFTRRGFTHQVRLNRRNNAMSPTGIYICIVPGEMGNASANISVGKCILY